MRPTPLFVTSLITTHLKRSIHTTRASRSLFSTIRRDDGTIILSSSSDDASHPQHSASVILCHGLGDTAEGWVEPAKYLANQLPHVKFLLPTAPTQPVTINMGFSMPSWYDITGLDSRSNEVCKGLDESMDTILNLIEQEITTTIIAGRTKGTRDDATINGMDYSRIVLAGFSQGGALALYTGMTRHRPDDSQRGLGLAGIVIMSGYLPRSSSFQIAKGSESTPILHCHGKDDPLVLVEAVELSKNRVRALASDMGVSDDDLYQVKIYPGLEHSVSTEELDDVVRFLERVIPPLEENDACDARVMGDPTLMSVRELREAVKRAGLEERARGIFEKSELVDLLVQHSSNK